MRTTSITTFWCNIIINRSSQNCCQVKSPAVLLFTTRIVEYLSQYYEYTSEEVILVLFLDFIYLSTAFHEYGTQREHRQQDKWSLLGLAPFVGEEVKVHNQPNLKVSIVIDTISIVIWKH